MATRVLITVDTELSLAQHQQGVSAAENLQSSIFGICDDGAYGIGYQMDRLDAHGLKAVFFVDPMPALAYGNSVLQQIVKPILSRGHDVQLHIHTEWLDFIAPQPVGDLRGRNIGDFPYQAQVTLLSLARKLLTDAGAPEPVAFRAGNYGANDDTVRALAQIGMHYDSSFNPAYLSEGCNINFPEENTGPAEYKGIIMLPVGGIYESDYSIRHAQICAISSQEMAAALAHAVTKKMPVFNIVTHSFELLNRKRTRPNKMIVRRFEKMCELISAHEKVTAVTFQNSGQDLPPVADRGDAPRLAPNAVRALLRRLQQIFGHLAYEDLTPDLRQSRDQEPDTRRTASR